MQLQNDLNISNIFNGTIKLSTQQRSTHKNGGIVYIEMDYTDIHVDKTQYVSVGALTRGCTQTNKAFCPECTNAKQILISEHRYSGPKLLRVIYRKHF